MGKRMKLALLTLALLFHLPLNLAGDDFQTKARFSDASITHEEDGTIYLTIESHEQIAGLQFALQYDKNKLLLGKPEFSTRNRHFSVYTGSDSSIMKVVAFSLEGKELDLTEPVLTIPLSAAREFEGTEQLTVKEFVASSPTGTRINLRVSAGKIYILPSLPGKFRFNQNFPNPFNGETIIRFDLPEDAIISLAIYNILGQRIRGLKDEIAPAGFHSVTWNGKDDSGQHVSSGEYVCSLKVGINCHTMKMVLLR